MSVLCVLFGHRPAFGYGNREGTGYFRTKFYAVDGCNVMHASCHCTCERCGEFYQVGMIHVPTREQLLKQT
jgi:hypothetical protein